LEEFGDRALAGLVEFLFGDDLDRRSGFSIGSLDVRTRDFDALQLCLDLRKGLLRNHHRRGSA
jgi:hypothetical protein